MIVQRFVLYITIMNELSEVLVKIMLAYKSVDELIIYRVCTSEGIILELSDNTSDRHF